jgi:hypothetical protein
VSTALRLSCFLGAVKRREHVPLRLEIGSLVFPLALPGWIQLATTTPMAVCGRWQ